MTETTTKARPRPAAVTLTPSAEQRIADLIQRMTLPEKVGQMLQLDARQDDAIPDGVIFIPFCYNEAAANMLTNPALDPFGKIPEFKYCAAKIEAVGASAQAAE